MEVYEAIRQMRMISEAGGCFSFSFVSYSVTNKKSHGIVEVQNARLLKNPPRPQNSLQDIMLHYRDLTTGDVKQCYQLLLLTFNGQDLTLK